MLLSCVEDCDADSCWVSVLQCASVAECPLAAVPLTSLPFAASCMAMRIAIDWDHWNDWNDILTQFEKFLKIIEMKSVKSENEM